MSERSIVQILAEHRFSYQSLDHGDHCACGWTGPDHLEHLADVLAQAGLLRDAPVTPRMFQDAPD